MFAYIYIYIYTYIYKDCVYYVVFLCALVGRAVLVVCPAVCVCVCVYTYMYIHIYNRPTGCYRRFCVYMCVNVCTGMCVYACQCPVLYNTHVWCTQNLHETGICVSACVPVCVRKSISVQHTSGVHKH